MLYASIENDIVYFRWCNDYNELSEIEETLGLIELSENDEYKIYKTDASCTFEHLILIGNNVDNSLSLKAQYQLSRDFDDIRYDFLEDE